MMTNRNVKMWKATEALMIGGKSAVQEHCGFWSVILLFSFSGLNWPSAVAERLTLVLLRKKALVLPENSTILKLKQGFTFAALTMGNFT